MKAYVLVILAISSFIVANSATDKQSLGEVNGVNAELEFPYVNIDRSEFVSQRRNERDDFKCPSSYGAFPDPKDCSYFYVCKNGRSSRTKCQRNMGFDVHRRTCLPRWLAVCGDGKEDYTKNPRPTSGTRTTPENDDNFKCSSLYGTYAHPTKCENYYRCVLFKATLQICPKSQLFDAVKKACMAEDKVNCGNRERPFVSKTTTMDLSTTAEKSTTIEEMESTEPDIDTTYSETHSEVPIIESTVEIKTEEPTETPTEEPTTETPTEEPATETPTDEPTTETPTEEPTTITTKPTGPPETDCDENDVDCIITETGEVSDWFTCPQDMGAYEHPSSNKLFIFCLNWKPSVKRCGQDLIFSTKLATCVPPDSNDDSSSE